MNPHHPDTMNTQRPTPRTDPYCGTHETHRINGMTIYQHAEELERELAEAQAKHSTVYQWIERNHPDGFIDSQTHLQNLERVTEANHDRLDAVERENETMRAAIQAAVIALRAWPKAGHGISTDFTLQSQAFRSGQSALAALKPFLPETPTK